ncbi:MAG TPA: flagellar biosynthesis protein FliQ [Dehalococcoidia bacterium]|nr:flagellar biosynthesis protein FliQ [Dehalococcoidia bacterium]
MTEEFVVRLAMDALWTGLKVAGPILIVTLVVGLVISTIQAVTQVNEATLNFVPKALALIATLALLGPWMLNTLVSYAASIFAGLPTFVK